MAMCEGTSFTLSRPSWCWILDRAPGGMPLAERDDPLFDLGVDLVRAGLGPMRAFGQGGQAALFIAPHPSIHGWRLTP